MKRSQISKAIGIALAGSALAFGAVSTASASTTSYNTFNKGTVPSALVSGEGGTDGWIATKEKLNGDGSGGTCAAGSYCGNGKDSGGYVTPFLSTAAVPWVGNDARTDTKFGYTGHQHLNWSAVINSTSDSAEISRNDSNTRYGIFADIDTAKGAWHDNKTTGWKHDSDIGLFVSDVTQTVTLDIKSLGPENLNADYGITIYEGMDSSTSLIYSHHGEWHTNTPAEALEYGGSGTSEAAGTRASVANPFADSGLETLVLDDVLNNNAEFTATAGTVYTIIVGGFQGGDWTVTRDNYQLDIKGEDVSAVPVPAATWLLGSGLVGLFSYGRRKTAIEA